MGVWGGGNCPPTQQDSDIFRRSRKFRRSGVETAMKKRVAVEKERVKLNFE